MSNLPCFADILSTYVDVFGGDLLRYVLGAGGVYLVVNIWLAHRLAPRKIRDKPIPKGQIRREIMASLRTVLIFAATGTTIAFLARAGWITIYSDIDRFGWPYVLLSIVILIVVHDAWFYWTHRALHYPPLFRRFHVLHHRSHNPTPFTSYSFDVGEAVINAVYLPLILFVVPAHPLALFIFVSHMMLRNALGHCGYEVFPANRAGKPLFDWMSTVTHHDLHHARAGYNMALYFTWWDRWMGTEHPDYHAEFARVARPLSLRNVKIGALVLAIGVALVAGRGEAGELRGRYATPGLGAIVEFAPCGAVSCGTLVWVWDASDMPHAKVGEVIVSDLTITNGAWSGRLKNPENGWTFKGRITAPSPTHLQLQGCAGPICAKQIWYRVDHLARILVAGS